MIHQHPTDLVRVGLIRSDGKDSPWPSLPDMPASTVPLVGDRVRCEGQWWRVDERAWTVYEPANLAALRPGQPRAWVDLIVSLVQGDRQ